MLLYSNHDLDDPQPWTLAVQIPTTLVHAIAILATVSRLLLLKCLSTCSWEDIWATLALTADIGCFASIWIQAAPHTSNPVSGIDVKSNWLLALAVTFVIWFARMSILSSAVRIANPTPKFRFVAYCVGAIFLAMAAGLVAQKIFLCMRDYCRIATSMAIVQLVSDAISDAILVAVPIRLLQDETHDQERRILVISVLCASMLISSITILHTVLLFQEVTDATIIVGHIKAALALFVCNAPVLVISIYHRLCRKRDFDLECRMARASGAGSLATEFTSVIDLPSKLSSSVLPGVQSAADTTHTRASTSDPSPRLEPDSFCTVTGGATELGDAEESKCSCYVCTVEEVGDE